MPGNGLEASEAWFQRFGMPLAAEFSAPTSFGSANWVLAFNDYENYPEFAKNDTRVSVCLAY